MIPRRKIVIPGLTRNPEIFYETLDFCFRRNDIQQIQAIVRLLIIMESLQGTDLPTWD